MVGWVLFTFIQLKNKKKNLYFKLLIKDHQRTNAWSFQSLKCTIICIQNLGWLNNIFFLSVQKKLSYQKEKVLSSKFISNQIVTFLWNKKATG